MQNKGINVDYDYDDGDDNDDDEDDNEGGHGRTISCGKLSNEVPSAKTRPDVSCCTSV